MAASKSTSKPAETKSAERPAARDLWQPLQSLRQEIDTLFDNFGRVLGGGGLFSQAAAVWPLAPAVDLAETDDRYELTAELPGLKEKDLEITVADHSLVIRGEKKEEREETRKDYHLAERRYGSFERRFPLPENAVPGKIEARFKNGVLMIVLPKSAAAKSPQRKIDVKAA